jgi:hypothetical protein
MPDAPWYVLAVVFSPVFWWIVILAWPHRGLKPYTEKRESPDYHSEDELPLETWLDW